MIEEKDDTYLIKKVLGEFYDCQSNHFKYLNSKNGFINSSIYYGYKKYRHYLKELVVVLDELGLYHLKANNFEKGEKANGSFCYDWTASKSELKRFENYLRTIIPSYNIRKTRAILKYVGNTANMKSDIQKFSNFMEDSND